MDKFLLLLLPLLLATFEPAASAAQEELVTEFAQLLAGLGVFTAVMAIMALGTEVIVQALTVFLGLKPKITAMEAYDKLEKELPGRLAALGADTRRVANLGELSSEIRRAIPGTGTQALSAASNWQDDLQQLQKGDFGPLFLLLRQRLPEGSTSSELEALQKDARTAVRLGFRQMRARLGLPKELTQEIETHILHLIDDVTLASLPTLPGRVHRAFQQMTPEMVNRWLQERADVVLERGLQAALAGLDELSSLLRELGLSEDAIATVEQGVQEELAQWAGRARREVESYVIALRNLLQAVEERRNEMQSPARKIYRRLRRSALSLFALLVGVIASLIVLVAAVLIVAAWDAGSLAKTAVSLVVVLAGLLAAGLLAAWADRRFATGPQLGSTLKAAERWSNLLLGRPNTYGQLPAEIPERLAQLNTLNVAQVLLEREDKHRDEETSRARLIRMISILVGTMLAYLLAVDAISLLGAFFPAIGDLYAVRLEGERVFTAGVILTGLAASAGSAFWHAQLGRIQGAKEQSEAVAKLLRRTRNVSEDVVGG